MSTLPECQKEACQPRECHELPRGEHRLSPGDAPWPQRAAVHEEKMQKRLGSYLQNRHANRKHPIFDFLFEYYSFRPSHLLRWNPGVNVVLAGAGADIYLTRPEFQKVAAGVTLSRQAFPRERLDSFRWIAGLLRETTVRPPLFGCFGLHEWAMVYRAPEVRYPDWPLRMTPEALAAFVESQTIRCSHYDAFRFFTPEARPLNQWQPERENRPELEQRGCVHVNMDLYKWAYKLAPWLPSEIVADAFELAWAARELDMRASPYDFTAMGFEAVRIETEEGRAEYVWAQQKIAAQAVTVRQRLLAGYESVLAWVMESP